MTEEVVPKICRRCGMPEHGSTSCEANRRTFDIEMETYEFEKAQELADEGQWPVYDDPNQCYNCGSYAKTYDGHTYVCPNCGDEWDIWLDPLEDY